MPGKRSNAFRVINKRIEYLNSKIEHRRIGSLPVGFLLEERDALIYLTDKLVELSRKELERIERDREVMIHERL